nr:hypothetical protein [uncultured Chloroflexus sp.]
MPNAPPPWYTVYQQTQRWLKARVFATLVHDLRVPPLPPPQGGKGGGARLRRARRSLTRARCNRPPLPPRRGGKGGAARAGDDGHQRPPLSPPLRGGSSQV